MFLLENGLWTFLSETSVHVGPKSFCSSHEPVCLRKHSNHETWNEPYLWESRRCRELESPEQEVPRALHQLLVVVG